MPTFCSKTQQRKKGQDLKNSFKSKVLLRLKGRITISVWSERKAEKWFPFLLSEMLRTGLFVIRTKVYRFFSLCQDIDGRDGWTLQNQPFLVFFAKLCLKTRKNASGRPWKEILLPDCCLSMLMVVQRKSGRRTLWTVLFADINILKTLIPEATSLSLWLAGYWVFWKFWNWVVFGGKCISMSKSGTNKLSVNQFQFLRINKNTFQNTLERYHPNRFVIRLQSENIYKVNRLKSKLCI